MAIGGHELEVRDVAAERHYDVMLKIKSIRDLLVRGSQ